MKLGILEKTKMMRKRKKMEIWIAAFLTIGLLFIFYQVLSSLSSSKRETIPPLRNDSIPYFAMRNPRNLTAFTGKKLVHLDLKGAPPRISYLRDIFPYLKGMGATGLLIEYEDMFPYSQALDRADNAYSMEEINTLLKEAEVNGLSVIPLIQTFGHLEFLLKLEKFRELREVPKYPQVICPTNENSIEIIKRMIDEVVQAHPNSKYIHIGCDEVYYVGLCDRCKQLKEKYSWSDHDLLLRHIQTIGNYIREKHAGVRPIIWGDMVKDVPRNLIQKYEIPQLVDIMLWNYRPNVLEVLSTGFLTKCASMFKAVWIAGAFKGATGANQILTDASYHLANLRSWMNIVAEWNGMIDFKGIVLTGWQRYDHFAVLCELLPVSLPVLVLELQYLGNIAKGTDESTQIRTLQCDGPLVNSPGKLEYRMTTTCSFPGFRIYEEVTNFFVLAEHIKKSRLFSASNGWFSSYNVINKYSSPAQVENFFDGFPVDKYRRVVDKAVVELSSRLLEAYDEATVNEWLLTHVTPLRLRLECLSRSREALLTENVWPRRPLSTKKLSPGTTDVSVLGKDELFCSLMSL